MSRLIRRAASLLAIVVLLVGLAFAGFVFAVVPRPEFQDWLRGEIATEFTPRIRFETVTPVLWPTPGLRLDGFALADGSGGLPVRARFAACRLSLRALLTGEFVVADVHVEGVTLDVRRTPDGNFAFGSGGMLDPFAATERSTGDLASAWSQLPDVVLRDVAVSLDDRSVTPPRSLHVEALEATFDPPAFFGRDATLRIAFDVVPTGHVEIDAKGKPDEATRGPADLPFEATLHGRGLSSAPLLGYLLSGLGGDLGGGRFDLDATLAGRASSKLDGRAKLTLVDAPAQILGVVVDPPLHADGGLAIEAGEISLSGVSVTSPAASAGAVSAVDVQGVLDLRGSTLSFSDVTFSAYDATWHAAGDVDWSDGVHWKLRGRVESADLLALIGDVSGTPVSNGFEKLTTDVALESDGTPSWRENATGSGTVHLEGGRLATSHIVSAVAREALVRVPGTRALAPKSGRTNALHHLDASIDVRDGRIFTSDLKMDTHDYDLEGKGSLAIAGAHAGDVEMEAKVALSATGVRYVYDLAARPFEGSKAKRMPAIPVRIRGPVASPTVRPELSGVAMGPLRALFDLGEGTLGLLGLGREKK